MKKKNEYLEDLKEMAGPMDEETQDVEETEEIVPLDKEGSLEFTVKIGKKDMRHFLFTHNYSSFSGWFGVIISLVAFGMLIAGFEKYSQMERGILVFLGLLFTVIRPAQIIGQANRQVRNQPMFHNEITYNICNDGIVITQGEEFANVLWEGVRKVRITGKAVIIYTSPVMAFILPLAQIAKKDELIARVKEKTGK